MGRCDMSAPIIAVCSAKPRAATRCAGMGNQWWAREVYHLVPIEGAPRTLCNRRADDWLTIGVLDALDENCCAQCRAQRDAVEGKKHGEEESGKGGEA